MQHTREAALKDLNTRICESRGWKSEPREGLPDLSPWVDPQGNRCSGLALPDHINGREALWHCHEAVVEMTAPRRPTRDCDEAQSFYDQLRALVQMANYGPKDADYRDVTNANAPALLRAVAIGLTKRIIARTDIHLLTGLQ